MVTQVSEGLPMQNSVIGHLERQGAAQQATDKGSAYQDEFPGFWDHLAHLAGSCPCCQPRALLALQVCHTKCFSTQSVAANNSPHSTQHQDLCVKASNIYLSEAAVSSCEEVFSRGVLFERLCLLALGGNDAVMAGTSGGLPAKLTLV